MSTAFTLSGHALLDFSVSFDPDAPPGTSEVAYSANLARLMEIDAVTATMDDDDVVTLQVGPLLNSAVTLIHLLIGRESAFRGVEREEIVMDLREFLDSLDDIDG